MEQILILSKLTEGELLPPILNRNNTRPASWAIVVNMDCDKSKCTFRRSHHPPLDPSGQKLVVVTTMDNAPDKQNWD